MFKKSVFLFVLLAAAVFVSGCTDGNTKQPLKSDYIPQSSLPSGFTYMGTHDIQLDIGGLPINAVEGVYRNAGDDIYIQVIENGKPGELLSSYKLQLKQEYKSDYNPFEEISFNGHTATKVTDYITSGGQQEPRYSIIWATDKYMVIVGSSSEHQKVLSLATATGH